MLSFNQMFPDWNDTKPFISPDSRVETDTKISSGYFCSGKQVKNADLFTAIGRTWEEAEH